MTLRKSLDRRVIWALWKKRLQGWRQQFLWKKFGFHKAIASVVAFLLICTAFLVCKRLSDSYSSPAVSSDLHSLLSPSYFLLHPSVANLTSSVANISASDHPASSNTTTNNPPPLKLCIALPSSPRPFLHWEPWNLAVGLLRLLDSRQNGSSIFSNNMRMVVYSSGCNQSSPSPPWGPLQWLKLPLPQRGKSATRQRSNCFGVGCSLSGVKEGAETITDLRRGYKQGMARRWRGGEPQWVTRLRKVEEGEAATSAEGDTKEPGAAEKGPDGGTGRDGHPKAEGQLRERGAGNRRLREREGFGRGERRGVGGRAGSMEGADGTGGGGKGRRGIGASDIRRVLERGRGTRDGEGRRRGGGGGGGGGGLGAGAAAVARRLLLTRHRPALPFELEAADWTAEERSKAAADHTSHLRLTAGNLRIPTVVIPPRSDVCRVADPEGGIAPRLVPEGFAGEERVKRWAWRARLVLDFMYAVRQCAELKPEMVLALQDDVEPAYDWDWGIQEFIKLDLPAENKADWSVLSLYAPRSYGWGLRHAQPYSLPCCAQAFLFNASAGALEDLLGYMEERFAMMPMDHLVRDWVNASGRKAYVHAPSLFQHVGRIRTKTAGLDAHSFHRDPSFLPFAVRMRRAGQPANWFRLYHESWRRAVEKSKTHA